jgi:hypothetical protein
MTTIDTTTSLQGFNSGRRVARTSTGRLWTVFIHSAALELWYSDDDGDTWTQNTNGTISGKSIVASAGCSLYIDVDDHAHVSYQENLGTSTHYLKYRRMANIGTTTSWDTSNTSLAGSSNASTGTRPDIVAFRSGATWNAAIAYQDTTGDSRIKVYTNVDTTPVLVQAALEVPDVVSPSLDFNHTGDGKTIAGSSPHLYVAGSKNDELRFMKFTWSGGTWGTSPTARLLDTSVDKELPVSHAFDGTRCVVAYAEGSAVYIAERDAADTTTTLRTPTALSDGTVTNLGVTFDSEGDIHLWASGTTSDDLKRIEFDRSAGTWGSWATAHTGTVAASSLSLKRGHSDSLVDAVFLDGTSTYDVVYESLLLNVAPTAPTWQAPGDNSANDIGASLLLDWQFNDAGDSQSAYILERKVNGGAAAFYNAGSSSWGGSETVNTSTTESVTLGSSWGSDGDSIAYRVKTRDASAAEGPFSAVRTVTGSTKVNPVLTVPADAGTVTSSTVEVTWTATEQTAYELRILTDADVQLSTTGKVTSTAKTVAPSTVLTNGEDYRVEIRTWNDDDLESSTDTHDFTVTFTAPATPVLTVTANTAGYMSVAIADPTPGGSQPTVVSHDIYVRVAAGGRQSGERPVGGDGIRISTGTVETDGTYLDRKAASNTDFEYRSLAIAGGATAFSAWT